MGYSRKITILQNYVSGIWTDKNAMIQNNDVQNTALNIQMFNNKTRLTDNILIGNLGQVYI